VLKFLLPYFESPAETVFAVGCLELEQAESTSGRAVLGGKNRLWFERGLFVHARAQDYTSGPTTWVSGGSGLFDKAKWLELGGFDEQFYPAYWEDIDLSYRASQRGWKVLFEAKAVVHHTHETTNASVFSQRQTQLFSITNGLRFFWKHATLPQKLAHFCWLPYHGLVTNLKTGGAFLKAYRSLISA